MKTYTCPCGAVLLEENLFQTATGPWCPECLHDLPRSAAVTEYYTAEDLAKAYEHGYVAGANDALSSVEDGVLNDQSLEEARSTLEDREQE